MICPGCSTELTSDVFPVDGKDGAKIGTCSKCARSLVLESQPAEFGSVDTLRFATSADLEHLDDSQVQQLRKARPSEWRKAVLAQKASLKGR